VYGAKTGTLDNAANAADKLAHVEASLNLDVFIAYASFFN
jgi:hypothetical protein